MSLAKKLLVGAAALVLLVVLLFVAVALFVDLDKVVNDQLAAYKPKLEAELGRKVETGKVSTSFFPKLGGKVEGFTIAADPTHPEDDQPLVTIQQVGFEVSFWQALLSGGKRIKVNAIYVDGMQVSVVRYKGGRLSYEDITERQAAKGEKEEKPAEPTADEPMSKETQELLRGLSVDEIRVADARFRLVDLDTPTGQKAESEIKKFNLKLKDVRLSDPIGIHMDAAIFADTRNFELDTSVGPLPADLKMSGAPKVNFFTLKANGIDLSKLTPYLGPAVPAKIDSAVANADWKVGEVVAGKPVEIAGFFEVKNVQVAGGTPFDARLDSDLKVYPDTLGADVAKLEMRMGSAAFFVAGSLRDLATKPSFQNLTVKSQGLNPAVLLSYYPPATADLPPGMKIAGDIGVDLVANGDADKQTVKGTVDLTPVDLFYPDTLVKPAGTKMALSVDGDFTSSDAVLRHLGFSLDALEFVMSGTVKNFSAPAMDLSAEVKPFPFDGLARLLPNLAAQLKAQNATASGQGSMKATIKGTQENLDANLDFRLLGLKLDVPDTELDGDVTLLASAKGNPKSDLVAQAKLEATDATIRVKGQLDKAAKVPMAFDLSAKQSGDELKIEKLAVRLAELSASATGFVNQAKGTMSLSMDLDRLDLEKLSKTVLSIPADKVKKSFVAMRMKVEGNPNDQESLVVSISELDAKLGKSDMRGSMTVRGISKPDVKMALQSDLLDVDELYPPKEGSDSSDEKTSDAPSAPEPDDPSLKNYGFDGTFQAKKIIYRGDELSNFRGAIKLRDGVMVLEDATFGIWGGTVTAKGTEAEIWRGVMPFKANLEVKGVDMAQALAAKTQYGGLMAGKADVAVHLTGRGFETVELEKALTGNMGFQMKEGKFKTASLTESVTGGLSSQLSKVPGLDRQAKLPGDNAFKDLVASFTVEEGKLKLVKPVVTAFDGNKLQVGGAIGIAGKLFLEGTYFVSAKTVNALTRGKCGGEEELPVPVKIEGTAKAPTFVPELGAVAGSLVERCLKTAGTSAAAKALGDKLGVTIPTSTAEAQKKLQQEAEAKRAQAEAAARAEADRVRAAAEAKVKAETDARIAAEKEKARKAAEEAAKKKAGGALKGIFK